MKIQNHKIFQVNVVCLKKKKKVYFILTNDFGQANQREEEYKNQIKTLTNRLKEVFNRTKKRLRLMRVFVF